MRFFGRKAELYNCGKNLAITIKLQLSLYFFCYNYNYNYPK